MLAQDPIGVVARVAYDSNVKFNGSHIYNYWSMRQKVSISCSDKFYKGDYVRIVAVGPGQIRVKLEDAVAAHKEPIRCLMFVSNHIPVPADYDLEFTATGCEILLTETAVENGNKIYLMLVLVPLDGRANIVSNIVNGEQLVFELRK